MRLSYPRSFLSLLLLGFVIVTAPLVAMLVANAIGFDRLAGLSERSVVAAVRVTQASRTISSSLAPLERTARQFALSGEATFLDAYRANRSTFRASVVAMDGMTLSGEQRAALAGISEAEEEIHTTLTAAPPSPELSLRLAAAFEALADRARTLSTLSDQVVEAGIEQVRDQAARARSRDLWMLVGLLPAAILLIAGFTFLIARPIHQVSAGIRRLGDGDFSRAIAVQGPSDMVRLGRQLDWLRRQLVELETQKTRFLQHVSHELKTPLTALREGSDLLATGVAGNLNAEQREIARILSEKSLDLRRLIEDLLSYNTAHASASALTARIVPLRDIVDRVLEDRRLPILAREIRVVAQCASVSAYCDEEKVRTILDNLVSNAIRHSPAGGTLRVGLYKDGADAVLEVADEGPGIPEADRDRIFEPFFRGEDQPAASVEGSGLGLSIVREYVRLHDGLVEVLPGPGARFRVRLPRRRLRNREQAA